MKELDYDLIEKVGATHFDNEGDLYKADSYKVDGFLRDLNESGIWVPTSLTPLGVIAFNVRPIPQRPKPNFEYAKAEFDEPWQAAKAFCDGAEFWCSDAVGKFYKVASQGEALRLSGVGSLYTRKEIESDWHKALADFLDGCDNLDVNSTLSAATVRYASGWDKKWDEEYIESCRVVLRELGELE